MIIKIILAHYYCVYYEFNHSCLQINDHDEFETGMSNYFDDEKDDSDDDSLVNSVDMEPANEDSLKV